jgi:hypothetical protein
VPGHVTGPLLPGGTQVRAPGGSLESDTAELGHEIDCAGCGPTGWVYGTKTLRPTSFQVSVSPRLLYSPVAICESVLSHTWSRQLAVVSALPLRDCNPRRCQGQPPLWSSGQSSWVETQRSPVRFPALPDFLSSSGSGNGSTQPS